MIGRHSLDSSPSLTVNIMLAPFNTAYKTALDNNLYVCTLMFCSRRKLGKSNDHNSKPPFYFFSGNLVQTKNNEPFLKKACFVLALSATHGWKLFRDFECVCRGGGRGGGDVRRHLAVDSTLIRLGASRDDK